MSGRKGPGRRGRRSRRSWRAQYGADYRRQVTAHRKGVPVTVTVHHRKCGALWGKECDRGCLDES